MNGINDIIDGSLASIVPPNSDNLLPLRVGVVAPAEGVEVPTPHLLHPHLEQRGQVLTDTNYLFISQI